MITEKLQSSKFCVHHVSFYNYNPEPILQLRIDKPKVYVLRSRGPIEVYVLKNDILYLNQLLCAPPNFITDTICVSNHRIFAGGITGEIIEYNAFNSIPKNRIPSNAGGVWCLEVDGSHSYLAAGTENGVVLVFALKKMDTPIHDNDNNENVLYYITKLTLVSANTGTDISDRVVCLAWEPNTNRIAVSYVTTSLKDGAALSGKIAIWKVHFNKNSQMDENETSKMKAQRQPHASPVINLDFLARDEVTPTGPMGLRESLYITSMLYMDNRKCLVTGDSYGNVRYWDPKAGVLMKSVCIHKAAILCLCPLDGSTDSFWASGVDPLVVRFDKALNGEWVKSVQRNVHENDVKSMASFNSWLISGGLDSKVAMTRGPPKMTIEIPALPRPEETCSKTRNGMLLLKYPHHLELWKMGSPANKELPTSPAALALAGQTLNGAAVELGDKPRKILEVRTTRQVKIPLEIIASDISSNGDFLAYSDINRTFVYSLTPHSPDDSQGNFKLKRLAKIANSGVYVSHVKFYNSTPVSVPSASTETMSKGNFKVQLKTLQQPLNPEKEIDPSSGLALILGLSDGNVRIYKDLEVWRASDEDQKPYGIIPAPLLDGNAQTSIQCITTRDNYETANPTSNKTFTDDIAISYTCGRVAVHNLDNLQMIWKIDNSDYPCTSLSFNPVNPEVVLVYADNTVCEYNYFSAEPTIWSLLFNSHLAQKFRPLWLDVLTQIGPQQGSSYPYNLIRGIFHNPQNVDQIVCYNQEALYLINKSQCCSSAMRDKHGSRALVEMLKYKYLVYFNAMNAQWLLALEVKPERILSTLLPALKKKKYGT